MTRRLALLACLVAAGGCDRAVLDPVGADLLATDPDLDVVLLEPDLALLPPEFGGPLAVDLGDRLALVVGGERAGGDPLATLEVFSAEAGRSFRVPTSVGLQTARVDAAATFLPDRRIVVVGGRTSGGAVISGYEAFQL